MIHAEQYDTPEQAAEAGGIAYVTDIDNMKVKEKLTLAECYNLILKDCSTELIEQLPERWDLSYGKMYAGLEGFRMCMSWNARGNPYGMTSVRTILSTAECRIRTGDIRGGLELTDIVRKAHVENASPYVRIYDMMPFGELAAMRLLQQTKWIECLGSYENFFDMKRWNTEPEYTTKVSKDLDIYGIKTLEPDSPLWILPFPAKATRYNPTLTQNF